LLVFIGFYIYANFYTTSMVVGKYVNENYEDKFIGYIAHVSDTLYLKEDNQFESNYYGEGTYNLIYDLEGTRIELNYSKGYSTTVINGEIISMSNEEGFETSISRTWFIGNLKIWLYKDLNQYYKKIE